MSAIRVWSVGGGCAGRSGGVPYLGTAAAQPGDRDVGGRHPKAAGRFLGRQQHDALPGQEHRGGGVFSYPRHRDPVCGLVCEWSLYAGGRLLRFRPHLRQGHPPLSKGGDPALCGSSQDCVRRCVNLGYDADSTAAIAGGLAGLYYGFSAIPPEWVEQLAGKEILEDCIRGMERFCEAMTEEKKSC